MPPKRSSNTSSPIGWSRGTRANATNDQQNGHREYVMSSDTLVQMDSSPLPPVKKKRKTKPAASNTNENKKSEVQLQTPDSTSDEVTAKDADAKQGISTLPRKVVARKRKAAEAESDGTAPASKRKKVKKTPEIIVDSDEDEYAHLGTVLESPPTLEQRPPTTHPESATKLRLIAKSPLAALAAKRPLAAKSPITTKPATPSKPAISTKPTTSTDHVVSTKPALHARPLPLPQAVTRKLRSMSTFLDTHKESLLSLEQENNNHLVNKLDLLAALIILSVDYQLEVSASMISFDATGEMIIATDDTDVLRVDFDRRCDIERKVRDKIKGEKGAQRLEDLSLVKIQVEMLLAQRKRLAEDGVPAAGFRVYGD